MKYLFLILGVFFTYTVFGQAKTPKLETFLNNSVLKGISGDGFSKTQKNQSYFYAIAFSFDKSGKVDTLFYSTKLDPNTKDLFKLDNSLLKRVKSHNYSFKEYASKTILVPFYHYNMSDESADYRPSFIASIENLVPEAILGKSIIILKPMVNAFNYHVN